MKNNLHVGCADLLMKEFGVQKQFRDRVIDLIAQIYHSERMAHCLIILSLRGFRQVNATNSLEYFLRKHGTTDPKREREEMRRMQEDDF